MNSTSRMSTKKSKSSKKRKLDYPMKITEEKKGRFTSEAKNEDNASTSLENVLFGNIADMLEKMSAGPREPGAMVTDAGDDSGVEEAQSEVDSPMSDSPVDETPAWLDEDDDSICLKDAFLARGRQVPTLGASADYSSHLKEKFQSIVGTPKWAELKNKHKDVDSDGSDDELLQHSGNFLIKKTGTLTKGILTGSWMKDLNYETRTEGPILKSVQFHRTSSVGLVAGLSGITSLFQVDGNENSKLQSVQFERFPVHCARFTCDGSQFVVGSQHHGHFFCYDMIVGKTMRIINNPSAEITHMKNFEMSPDGSLIAVCGRYGNIHLITSRTKEYIGTLKMNGEVTAITFNADGSRMISHGDGGELYIWNMNSRSCIHQFIDDGCIVGSSVAVSPSGQFLACGSRSGVVNVYDFNTIYQSKTPRPLKIFLNLTTAVTSLKFNSNSEILAMGSMMKDNAMKMAHFPSMTVFSNFPGIQNKMFRPQCLDFSVNSGFLTLGNNKGKALLYRLKHYGNY